MERVMSKQEADVCEFSNEDILKLAQFFEILMGIDKRLKLTEKDEEIVDK